jgi:hypothetical protein
MHLMMDLGFVCKSITHVYLHCKNVTSIHRKWCRGKKICFWEISRLKCRWEVFTAWITAWKWTYQKFQSWKRQQICGYFTLICIQCSRKSVWCCNLSQILSVNLINLVHCRSDISLTSQSFAEGFILRHNTEICLFNEIMNGKYWVVHMGGTAVIFNLRHNKIILNHSVAVLISEICEHLWTQSASSPACDTIH